MATSQLTVRMNGVPHSTYKFKLTETVYELKIKIEKLAKIKRQDQLLLLGPNPLIQDYKILFQYGIIDGCIIDLHSKPKDSPFNVTIISEDGIPIAVIPNLSPFDFVMNLKNAIKETLGYSLHRQLLFFLNEELYDVSVLRDFSVTSQPTVMLVAIPRYLEMMFKVRVVEKGAGRLMAEVFVDPHDTVRLLEWRVRNSEEMGGREFQLFYGMTAVLGSETMESLDARRKPVFDLIFWDEITC